jgi:hypothetical protein
MENIREIIEYSRGTGNTSWILKSALENPDCIIVAGHHRSKEWLKEKYIHLFNQQSWFNRVLHKLRNKPHPLFVTKSEYARIRGMRKPVILDNSCFSH